MRGWYSPDADRGFARVDRPGLSEAGVGVSLSWTGRPNTSTPVAHLEASVPATVFETPIGPHDTLSLVVDDTLRFALGVPKAPTFRGQRMPRFAPIVVNLPHGAFVALARASTAAVSFRGTALTAGRTDLPGINALFRILACGPVLPER